MRCGLPVRASPSLGLPRWQTGADLNQPELTGRIITCVRLVVQTRPRVNLGDMGGCGLPVCVCSWGCHTGKLELMCTNQS